MVVQHRIDCIWDFAIDYVVLDVAIDYMVLNVAIDYIAKEEYIDAAVNNMHWADDILGDWHCLLHNLDDDFAEDNSLDNSLDNYGGDREWYDLDWVSSDYYLLSYLNRQIIQ